MRFYTKQHRYYCGIDLHARSMYLCILDSQGEILLHRNMPCAPELFLKAVAPYREDLAIAVECIFTWYWLADLCARENIAFVLGHALYMKAIHGGKAKNDRRNKGDANLFSSSHCCFRSPTWMKTRFKPDGIRNASLPKFPNHIKVRVPFFSPGHGPFRELSDDMPPNNTIEPTGNSCAVSPWRLIVSVSQLRANNINCISHWSSIEHGADRRDTREN